MGWVLTDMVQIPNGRKFEKTLLVCFSLNPRDKKKPGRVSGDKKRLKVDKAIVFGPHWPVHDSSHGRLQRPEPMVCRMKCPNLTEQKLFVRTMFADIHDDVRYLSNRDAEPWC